MDSFLECNLGNLWKHLRRVVAPKVVFSDEDSETPKLPKFPKKKTHTHVCSSKVFDVIF